jgi:hypothetical protein
MRSFLLVSALLLLTGCSATSPLVGSWARVEDHSAGRSVKVLAEDHFAFGRAGAEDCATAGGGTYTYRDGRYAETIAYHWMPELVGRTIEFDCRIEDDLWYHSGEIRLGNTVLTINEVWKRIETD